MRVAWNFIKKEIVLTAAVVLAVISMLIVHPDAGYADYVDYRTIGLLFALMIIMAGFGRLGVFDSIGRWLLGKVRGSMALMFVLVFLCFFFSMFITNDVALITFVPFAIQVLAMAGAESLAVPVVVMQTVAANMGSMLTPIGNPQNLYLYSLAGMGAGNFVLLMLPYTLISGVLLAVMIILVNVIYVRKGKIPGTLKVMLDKPDGRVRKGDNARLVVYVILFAGAIATVARVVPWWIFAAVTAAVMLIADRRLYAKVDYALLMTFAAFFVFIGNMGRVEAFAGFLERIIGGREVYTAVVASQVISNVPAALLLSGFTGEYGLLIVGVNLGGLGTLIASMASLISFKQVAGSYPKLKGKYFGLFTLVNIIFLAVLLVAQYSFFR